VYLIERYKTKKIPASSYVTLIGVAFKLGTEVKYPNDLLLAIIENFIYETVMQSYNFWLDKCSG